jgi:hypothetical protein
MADQVATPPPQEKADSPPSEKPAPQPLANPFADIDELMRDDKPAEEPQPKKAAPQKTIHTEKVQQKPTDKLKQTQEQKPETTNVKTLRENYEATTKRVKELEAEVQKSKQPTDDQEKKSFAERIESLDKRRKELEQVIEEAAFERSDRYKHEFETPLRVALEIGKELVEGIEIEDSEGNKTKGTEGMFIALCKMERSAAKEQARVWFGDEWSAVMAEYGNVNRAKKAAENAITEHRTYGVERVKQHREESEKQWENARQSFRQHVGEGIEKHPELFKPEDDDVKGKQLLAKGMEMADSAFGHRNGIPTPDVVARDAAIRNKAGGYDYLAYKWRKAEKRVSELETRLKEFEASEPGEGSGKRTPKAESRTWEQEIEALATG